MPQDRATDMEKDYQTQGHQPQSTAHTTLERQAQTKHWDLTSKNLKLWNYLTDYNSYGRQAQTSLKL